MALFYGITKLSFRIKMTLFKFHLNNLMRCLFFFDIIYYKSNNLFEIKLSMFETDLVSLESLTIHFVVHLKDFVFFYI